MSDVVARLNAIRERVSTLIQERDRLSDQLSGASASERQRAQELAVLTARITELEKENEVLRSSVNRHGAGAGDTGVQQRIDDLVNEIDRCLALIDA